MGPRRPGGARSIQVATPRSIRYLNEIQALNALFREGGMSRADLARRLRLNRSSIGFIVRDLLADRLAREGEPARTGGVPRTGRPGIVVEIDPDGATFLGIEIGVDHVTVVAIDLAAREILRRSVAYPTGERPPATGIAKAAEMLDAAIASLGSGRSRIRGACVAVPALVREGVVRNGQMLGWRNVPLQRMLELRLGNGLPVVVENDANAFAIGETYRGAAARPDTAAFLLIENGAGGGVVVGGRLLRGSSGFAGEFGQLPLGSEWASPRADRSGRLESQVGKDAVLARYRAHGAPPSADLPHLLSALRAGDAAAQRTADEWGDSLACGLVAIADALDPGLIVLGGSVAALFPYVQARVEAAMRAALLEGFPVPRIELSALGPGGAAFGGACLLHQAMFEVDERLVHSQEGRPRRPRGKERKRGRSRRPAERE
jgi:predicted NBD/HSP70 family sugar kinase